MADLLMPALRMTAQKLFLYRMAVNLPLFDYAAAPADLLRMSRWMSLKPNYVRRPDYHFQNRIRPT